MGLILTGRDGNKMNAGRFQGVAIKRTDTRKRNTFVSYQTSYGLPYHAGKVDGLLVRSKKVFKTSHCT